MNTFTSLLLTGLLASTCAACVVAPAGTPVAYAPAAAPTNCRDFKTTIQVDGRSQDATGVACEQPDGTWKVTSPATAAALAAPPPPTVAYAPYYYPYPPYYYDPYYYYGPPVTVGIGVGFHHHW